MSTELVKKITDSVFILFYLKKQIGGFKSGI